MSVAFRRESDDEHKEPRFELPLPPGPNLVTARGLAAIGDMVGRLEQAVAAHGEPADDAVRAARDDDQRSLRYWRTRLATARLTEAPAEGVAGFGSRVRFSLGGRERMIDIVGGDEADPAADRIAFFAPLARAMMGAEVGERVDFNGKVEAIEVLAAAPIPE
ncbi:transcription elongation GreA/GreB family factor [Sphingomonas zeicaulis]|uniref:GreA/GreB family elongation factor n=1 Tax=Sphingomonas zeicaulis TaxID=1632740 RepID=UPI003D261009